MWQAFIPQCTVATVEKRCVTKQGLDSTRLFLCQLGASWQLRTDSILFAAKQGCCDAGQGICLLPQRRNWHTPLVWHCQEWVRCLFNPHDVHGAQNPSPPFCRQGPLRLLAWAACVWSLKNATQGIFPWCKLPAHLHNNPQAGSSDSQADLTHSLEEDSLGIVWQGVCRQLPVVLLHPVHDVILIITDVLTLGILLVIVEGKGYTGHSRAAPNQVEVAWHTHSDADNHMEEGCASPGSPSHVGRQQMSNNRQGSTEP